jgi:hypothetical protein
MARRTITLRGTMDIRCAACGEFYEVPAKAGKLPKHKCTIRRKVDEDESWEVPEVKMYPCQVKAAADCKKFSANRIMCTPCQRVLTDHPGREEINYPPSLADYWC